jgi:4-hydroxythreonine-4-phosphate dehydrogenase
MIPHPALALTMGEPAGIGAEITLKAWLHRHLGVPPFFAIDDPGRLQALAMELRLDVPIAAIDDPEEAPHLFSTSLPVLTQLLAAPAIPGKANPANARAVMAAIERAVVLVGAGRAAGVVTNPINKKILYGAGFNFPGHTEYLAHLAGSRTKPVMMLAAADLRVVLVSIHVPIKDAIASLTTEAIVTTGIIAAEALARDFGIARPRIALAGLNPHAGEGGALGREEIEIVTPAAQALRARGIDVTDPLPPDTMFHERARRRYDAALCLYHDQALIPIKTIAFDTGVNVTLGLPFVRTSPDHGTAFDIAGQGIASPDSLVAALRLAGEMSARRAAGRLAEAV